MATGIRHAFVSGKSDDADATLVNPSDWNAEHSPNLTTKGDLLVEGAAAADRLGVGSNNEALVAASGEALGLKYAAVILASLLTTEGDVIFRNATVPARLAIGSAEDILHVNAGATAPEWGKPTRTRALWIPGRDFDIGTGSPTWGVSGSWSDVAWAWTLPDGSTTGLSGIVAIPADWKSGAITPHLLYEGAGAGNFYATVGCAVITADNTESMEQTDDAVHAKAISSYNNAYLEEFASGAVTPASAGEFLNIQVSREGGHVSDTSANDLRFYGVRLTYTAEL